MSISVTKRGACIFPVAKKRSPAICTAEVRQARIRFFSHSLKYVFLLCLYATVGIKIFLLDNEFQPYLST